MRIYKLAVEATKKWVWFSTIEGPIHPNNHEGTVAFFDQQPHVRIDRNVECTPKTSSARLADCSNLDYGPLPVLSARAKAVLGPRIDALGQWLKLECEEAPYWLFNVTNIVDALDEDHSELLRFPDGGVMRIARFAFHPERLRGQLLFTLPQRPGSPNLVTDEFVKLVEQHKLTGFDFKLLWSDEEDAGIAKAA